MESVVVEHYLSGKVAASYEDHPWTIRIAGEHPATTALDKSNWRPVPVEELAHSAERIACKADLREFGIQSPNSGRSGQIQGPVKQVEPVSRVGTFSERPGRFLERSAN